MSLLELCEIEMHFGYGDNKVQALEDINLTVQEGDFIAITGKSGCGKTTLLNVLACITKATGGRYFFRGQDITHISANQSARFRNRNLGFIVQHFALIPSMTVYKNIALPLVYQRCSANDLKARVTDLARLLEIDDKLDCYPEELSGGQSQRAAIARAIATKPALLLADEPTGALDEETGKKIMDLFSELNAAGTTILLVTHDMEVASVSHHIVKMRDGHIFS